MKSYNFGPSHAKSHTRASFKPHPMLITVRWESFNQWNNRSLVTLGAFARPNVTQGPNRQFSDSNGLHLNPLSHSTYMDICISSFPLDVTGKASLKQMFSFLKKVKATGFKSLRINYWEIIQITSKCQMDFLVKTCRSKMEKSKQHHWILHIRITYNLGHNILELYNILV